MNIERAKELFKMRIETEEYSGMTTNTLKEAMTTVLAELEKKDKVINEIEDLCIRKSDDEGEEYGGVIIWNFAHKIMEIINKVEREGK